MLRDESPNSPLYNLDDTEPMEPITDADIHAYEMSRMKQQVGHMRQLINAIAHHDFPLLERIFLRHGGNQAWYRNFDASDQIAIVAATVLQWLDTQEQ